MKGDANGNVFDFHVDIFDGAIGMIQFSFRRYQFLKMVLGKIIIDLSSLTITGRNTNPFFVVGLVWFWR